MTTRRTIPDAAKQSYLFALLLAAAVLATEMICITENELRLRLRVLRYPILTVSKPLRKNTHRVINE